MKRDWYLTFWKLKRKDVILLYHPSTYSCFFILYISLKPGGGAERRVRYFFFSASFNRSKDALHNGALWLRTAAHRTFSRTPTIVSSSTIHRSNLCKFLEDDFSRLQGVFLESRWIWDSCHNNPTAAAFSDCVSMNVRFQFTNMNWSRIDALCCSRVRKLYAVAALKTIQINKLCSNYSDY